MPESDRSSSKSEVLRKKIDKAYRDLQSPPKDPDRPIPAPVPEPTPPPPPPGPATARADIHIPIDESISSTIDELGPSVAYMDDRPGDPLAGYVACLKSLCNTCGGTWVDDNPGTTLAGCYFPNKVEAAGYAAFAWSCIPGGVLKYIMG